MASNDFVIVTSSTKPEVVGKALRITHQDRMHYVPLSQVGLIQNDQILIREWVAKQKGFNYVDRYFNAR